VSTVTIEQPYVTEQQSTPAARPVRRRAPKGRPVGRPGRAATMPPRSYGGAAKPRAVVPPYPTAVRACRVGTVSRGATSWRLTDRGIALVLTLAALLVVAAVTVIGLTAWRVTSPGYQTSGVSEVSRR
jgi:hypothetical protein